MLLVLYYHFEAVLGFQLLIYGPEGGLRVKLGGNQEIEVRCPSGRDAAAELVRVLGKAFRTHFDLSLEIVPYKYDFLDVSCADHVLHFFPFYLFGFRCTLVPEQHIAYPKEYQKIYPGQVKCK